MAEIWNQGDEVVVDEDSGAIRPFDAERDDYGQTIGTISIIELSANGHVMYVNINFTATSVCARFRPIELSGRTSAEAMAQSVREAPATVTYSHGRVPPECWVCGLQPAAEGPTQHHWFRQFFHYRHQTWMPVCEGCTTTKMELRT